ARTGSRHPCRRVRAVRLGLADDRHPGGQRRRPAAGGPGGRRLGPPARHRGAVRVLRHRAAAVRAAARPRGGRALGRRTALRVVRQRELEHRRRAAGRPALHPL
ncbi:MAG: NADH-ubiquinone oxidoreductase chain L, partial [uncultured Friedmanniella sp.]